MPDYLREEPETTCQIVTTSGLTVRKCPFYAQSEVNKAELSNDIGKAENVANHPFTHS
jgi:hypothetical protein